jgi:hypothetical protein
MWDGGATLALAGVLACVAAAAIFFGVRSLTASPEDAPRTASPVPEPTPEPAWQREVDAIPPVARERAPASIIIAATIVVLQSLPEVAGTVAVISVAQLPAMIAFLALMWQLVPFVGAVGLVGGWPVAWRLIVFFEVIGLIKLVWVTTFLSSGTLLSEDSAAWLGSLEQWAQLPDFARTALLAVLWCAALTVLAPLLTPSARRWCSGR